MASEQYWLLAPGIGSFSPLPCFAPAARRFSTAAPFRSLAIRPGVSVACSRDFGWDDVFRVAKDERAVDDPSDLRGYFDRVRACNRGSEFRHEFVPFIVEGQVVGYIHNGFVDNLLQFQDVFDRVLGKDGIWKGEYITLRPSLKTPEEKTLAVGNVIERLDGPIPGIRNELYPVSSSFGVQELFSIERAAAPYFGIKAYGVHMNGYVDGQEKLLWIGKRNSRKPTYPGMLDNLVAGGQPHGITCKENLIKECEEEAGIPRSISEGAIPVGVVSYMDIDGQSFKRDALFCFDLNLPAGFVPKNEDGEVDSFRLIPASLVANIIRRAEFFKPNCCLVVIDFLIRHGYISPDDSGYLELLQSLRCRGLIVHNSLAFQEILPDLYNYYAKRMLLYGCDPGSGSPHGNAIVRCEVGLFSLNV